MQTVKKLQTMNSKDLAEKRKMNQVIFLHDDTRMLTCLCTREEIAAMGQTILLHSLYSPELAPSDCCVVDPLKEGLKGHCTAEDKLTYSVCVKNTDISTKSFVQLAYSI